MGRTILAAGEWEESDAECVYGEFGGMRGEAGGDDSGDESGVGTEVTTQTFIRSKQRKTAVHQKRWIAVLLVVLILPNDSIQQSPGDFFIRQTHNRIFFR